jgi:putative FmdB family regulatory protein
MPLFEYDCLGCHQRFEFLTREGRSPACPACKSEDLQKLNSVFAAQSSTPAKSFSDRPMSAASGSLRETSGQAACGACGDPRGPGSCSMN